MKPSAASQLDRIKGALAKLGEPETDTRIARLLGSDPSTIWRWRQGKARPRGRGKVGLAIVANVAAAFLMDRRRAADRIFRAYLASDGLAGLGHAGLLNAAGLRWALKEGAGSSP